MRKPRVAAVARGLLFTKRSNMKIKQFAHPSPQFKKNEFLQ